MRFDLRELTIVDMTEQPCQLHDKRYDRHCSTCLTHPCWPRWGVALVCLGCRRVQLIVPGVSTAQQAAPSGHMAHRDESFMGSTDGHAPVHTVGGYMRCTHSIAYAVYTYRLSVQGPVLKHLLQALMLGVCNSARRCTCCCRRRCGRRRHQRSRVQACRGRQRQRRLCALQ